MFPKVYLFVAFIALFATVNAANVERQNLGSIINSLTSDAGSVVSVATSAAGSALSVATSEAGNVFSTVTSIGGSLATVITSKGGQAITLATGAGGKVTSFAGSQYTIATAALSSATSNAAMGAHSFGFTNSVLMGLASVVASIFVGAWLTV